MAADGRYVPVTINRVVEIASGTQKPHRFVIEGSTANKVKQAGAGAKNILGVLLPDLRKDEYADGDPAAVAVKGVVNVEAGAAVTAGDEVVSDANGRAIPYTAVDVPGTFADTDVEAAVAETRKIRGRAMTSAAQAGDIIEVVI